MKAIVQDGYGSADVVHLRDVDRPVLTADRVLVRVHAASVNALDWHGVHGGRLLQALAFVMRQPSVEVLGADLAGRVEAVGANVTAFSPGDEVFGSGRGTFAEYATSSERALALKPRGITFEQAAAMSVAGRTALQGLRDHAHVRPGQRVLINGAGGGVGTFAVQIAKALGAHVTAVTGTPNVELVRSLGPDEVVDYAKEDFARRGARYDVVFDLAANRSIGDCRRALGPGGTLVLVGAAKGSLAAILWRIGMAAVRSRVLRQRVVFYVARPDPNDLAVLGRLAEEGKVVPAIDRTYPLSEAREAVRYLGTGHARAKVVITIGGPDGTALDPLR